MSFFQLQLQKKKNSSQSKCSKPTKKHSLMSFFLERPPTKTFSTANLFHTARFWTVNNEFVTMKCRSVYMLFKQLNLLQYGKENLTQ